jgi:hypothetical protein
MEVVTFIHEAKMDEPMIKTVRKRAGKANVILFVLNGRVVQPREYETLQLRKGDDIRWFHLYAGG